MTTSDALCRARARRSRLARCVFSSAVLTRGGALGTTRDPAARAVRGFARARDAGARSGGVGASGLEADLGARVAIGRGGCTLIVVFRHRVSPIIVHPRDADARRVERVAVARVRRSDPEKGRVGKPSVGWAEDDGEDPGVGSGSGVGRGGRGSRTGLSYVLARVNYVGDSYLSQAVYQTYALVVLSVVLTCGGGVAYHYLGDTDVSMFDGMWATFTWISTGILGSGLTPTSIQAKSCASVLVVLGILYFSIILGLVVEGVQGKMKALREGKSTVIEREHTVMLGWTEKSLLFIREIINANESEGGGVIVVLCHEGKEAMERELGLFLKKRDMKGTTVVFRQGSRLMIGDLDKVAVSSARSVVVLSDTSLVADKADAEVLQVILNLTNLDLSGHVVAEVRDKDNEALIHLIGRGNVETVVSHDIIGRLMLMSVRQPGLAEVYGSVLGFEGDEFAEHWPELIRVKYKDVQLMLPDAIPIRVKNMETGAIAEPAARPRHVRGGRVGGHRRGQRHVQTQAEAQVQPGQGAPAQVGGRREGVHPVRGVAAGLARHPVAPGRDVRERVGDSHHGVGAAERSRRAARRGRA